MAFRLTTRDDAALGYSAAQQAWHTGFALKSHNLSLTAEDAEDAEENQEQPESAKIPEPCKFAQASTSI